MQAVGRFFALVALALGVAAGPAPRPGPAGPEGGHELVRGITISCQTWGKEWASEGFGHELDDLRTLGANWVAIHPYARVHGDGRVTWRALDPERPPPWIARPIAEARRRGIAILIKPHLAYWGSPFRWRGDIGFEDPAARERFWSDYTDWIVSVARVSVGADAFAVGTELRRLEPDTADWRSLIQRVRAVSDARLTYAANWDAFQAVEFWDELDAVGVQAYFPLADGEDPGREELAAGWERALVDLRALHRRTGKPVVFTELGYDTSTLAARRPWQDAPRGDRELERARALQERCLATALDVLERERSWLRGAFLWKWFVGEPGWNDASFYLDTPEVRGVLARSWAAAGR